MIAMLRRLAAVAALGLCLPAAATTYSVDHTDLWYNSGENGWGINLIQQNDTIFATLFVYGATGSAHWFVASDVKPSPAGSQTSFSGTLYETSGPYFALGAFNPAAVNTTPVGTLTLNFSSATSGTLQYTVNNLPPVTKIITRQTWAGNVLTGHYLGGITAQSTNCSGGFADGPILVFNDLLVQHNANQSITFTINFFTNTGQAATCTLTGLYSQSGRLGSVAGAWGCTVPDTGTLRGPIQGSYAVSEITATQSGFSGKFTGSDQYCTYNGYFGGVHDVL